MSSHDHGHDSHPSPHGAYETSDASIHAVSVSGVSIFITVAVAMVLMFGLVLGLTRIPAAMDRKPTASEMQRALPQGPRLQVDEPGDLVKFRAHEQQLLDSYGRQPNSGAVRIPVSRAMEIVAERGLGAKPAEAKSGAAVAAAKPAAEPAKPVGGVKPAH
ncbi:MAG: hypothetical protein U0Q16_36880 [Bryobacteraceae bacterium]